MEQPTGTIRQFSTVLKTRNRSEGAEMWEQPTAVQLCASDIISGFISVQPGGLLGFNILLFVSFSQGIFSHMCCWETMKTGYFREVKEVATPLGRSEASYSFFLPGGLSGKGRYTRRIGLGKRCPSFIFPPVLWMGVSLQYTLYYYLFANVKMNVICIMLENIAVWI